MSKENSIHSPTAKSTSTGPNIPGSHSVFVEIETNQNTVVTESQAQLKVTSTIDQSENTIEIIKLRHELAERWGGSRSSIEAEVESSLVQKRPQSMIEMTVDQEKKKQKKGPGKAKKTVRFDEPQKAPSTLGIPSQVPSDKISSSAGNSTFDTLSRIIRLNQLLRSSNSEPPPKIQIDLLTLEAIKEAAVGLLTTLHQSIHETSRQVFEKRRLTASTIPRATHLITQSISSALSPLFLPEHFSMLSSGKTEAIRAKWSQSTLPFIYQNRLEEYFRDDRRSKTVSFEADNMIVLREELQNTANDVIRQSCGWTGDFQFSIIKNLLGKMQSIYFTSGHKPQDLEALGILAELLESISNNLSQSTVAETNLVEIRAIIGKIVCNQHYGIGHSHSPIIDRKFDRILMQFWVL
ncbi:hypothetical protein PTTG_25291 [Puccinia triticina 1-1 BBBD Race 1]|uniref:Uncharacterized protein n=1 Tax=Puccinia triticina (isolate 1-1 / race 1 (BBBD)) TaxID=630390 RepID=A0A180H485_PUCT1|nr:hypothetical protein PTTG_25291 [Puccinia triticina 1-1 BBBD Race 1]